MGKSISSIDKKTLKRRPDLLAFVEEVQNKVAALELLKAQRKAAKKELKLAEQALKKQLNNKPPKKSDAPEVPIVSAVALKAVKPPTAKPAAKKNASKAVTA